MSEVERRKVCIQGLGFVGAAMAAAVSQARDAGGEPLFDVVGVDLANAIGQARVNAVNSGAFPFETADASLAEAMRLGHKSGNLRASTDVGEYDDADIIVVDVHLDVDFDANPPKAKFDNFLKAI